MLLLVLTTVICGALAAPAPQLEVLEAQPGVNTRFVPLVVQVPEAAPGIVAPVVVSSHTDSGLENQPGNSSSAIVFLVNNTMAEVSALLNGTTNARDNLSAGSEATEIVEEVIVEAEPATLVDLPLVEVLSSVDAIESVRQQAEAVVADDVTQVVAIAEAELKAEAQLEERILEAVAVEKAIKATDAQSVFVSVPGSNGPAVNAETNVVAAEELIGSVDQAVVQQIQETVASEQVAEVAIEEKVADIKLAIETEEKLETAILEQANEASVIQETVESVNNKKTELEQISGNALTGKSLLPSSSTTDEVVSVNAQEARIPLSDALSTVMTMVLKAAQEHILATTTVITEKNASRASTQVRETPAVLVSEVVPAIGGLIEEISGNTQEVTNPTLAEAGDSTPEVLIGDREVIAESSPTKDTSEIVVEQQVTESLSKNLDEAEQTILAAEEIISTAEGSVTDFDSSITQEQNIVHLEPVAIVLDNVFIKGKAISDGQVGDSDTLTAQAVQEASPVSVVVQEVVAEESPASATEEIVVEEVATAVAQDEISVAELSSTTLEEILSEQAPDTSAIVIIPTEFTEELSEVPVQQEENIQEEGSGTSTTNQAKQITDAAATAVAEESSTKREGTIEIAVGSSIREPEVTAPEVAPLESVAVVETSTPVESVAIEETSAPVESAAVVKTSAPVESVAVEETSAPVESVAVEETAAPVESVAVEETSAPVESVAVEETSAPVESVAIEETSAPVKSVAIVETSALAEPVITEETSPVESVGAEEVSSAVQSTGAVESSSLGKSQTAAEETNSVSESASPSQITEDVAQSIVTQSKQLPTPAQQNLLVGSGGRVVFGTSTFGSSVSPANFIIGQPVRVPQQVALDLAARSARRSGTDQARTLVGPRFQQFIFDNDSPDVVAAKVNFFRARAASLGAPLALSVQHVPAGSASPAAAAQ